MASNTYYTIGIDEAGRGSLVGEMMVAAVAVPLCRIDELHELGVKDSKMLTPAKRRELYDILSRELVFAVVPVKPQDIDKENLTILTSTALAKSLRIIFRRIPIENTTRIVIDKFGSTPRIKITIRKLGYRKEIIIEEKADAKYVEVGAASIIAKHVRDTRLKVLRNMYGVEGSGYPSDPRTIEWLEKIIASGNVPPIIRYSWGTLKGTGLYVKKRKQKHSNITLDEFF